MTTATLKNIEENDYAYGASKLTNAELLEFYEIFLEKVEGRHGIKTPQLWKHYTEGLAALEAEIEARS
jgi:hypothetical protein